VAHSRYWRSTAIFITYDEGGGFWDRLAPSVASGYGTRTPLVIVSPWVRRGAFRSVTTNISVLSFLQRLWRMPPLTALNAGQNNLFSAFDFRRRPLARPRLPVAPPFTIGFHGRTLLSQPRAAYPNRPLRLYLDAENRGLGVNPAAHGRLTLTVTPPRGVRIRRFPHVTALVRGRAMVQAWFPAPGYYRIRADGPHGSVGWTTIVVLRPGQHLAPGTWGLDRSTM
jgi:phospholipase C